ncbi:MAG: PAS domain-containing protein [Acidobacteriia bacterium]|nr:PAS domain-containing protein [Terriglobia bacterium]
MMKRRAHAAKLAAIADYNVRAARHVEDGFAEQDAQERAEGETLARLQPDLKEWRRQIIAAARRMFESGRAMALTIDGRVAYVNPSALDLLRRDRPSLIGMPASLIEAHNETAPDGSYVAIGTVEIPYRRNPRTLAAWRAERARLTNEHPRVTGIETRTTHPLAGRPVAGNFHVLLLKIWADADEQLFDAASRIAGGKRALYEGRLRDLIGRMARELGGVLEVAEHIDPVIRAKKGQPPAKQRAFRAALEKVLSDLLPSPFGRAQSR